ncbi:tyrosine-type recombinase/integrase [Cryobacterium glucosi]|uniref:Site-specific integrase n=1 Tax=Cryobacterium glucosi TaxID=1259175 RepID=A0ABY2IKA9_9MICO|nr:tyrosine-type recombinase/integrase [Cryobacterium glucosi]TFC16538.1 site-specific integrase [Cryobacterium glucosi]
MTTDLVPPRDYRPINALPYWDVIGEFVSAAVTDTSAATGRDERSLYPAIVAFVLWCWQSRGTPLDRKRMFRRSVVEEFIHLAMTRYTKGSRATHRATLWLTIETLNPDDLNRSRRPISRSAPTKPYSSTEVAQLYSWARSQGTEHRRRDAIALLALGLGAGLAAREILGVRVSDIDTRTGTIQVIVWEGRQRVVPIRADWERPLRRILSDLQPGDWLFRPGRVSATSGQVTDFLLRARTELDVRPSRMRATWLLEHLRDGTPPQQLLRIAGLKNLAALDKIATFTPRTGVRPQFSPDPNLARKRADQ